MLSYQHGYHAGAFADVIKHLALTQILNYMTIKDKALFYLETHAGRGMYDLYSSQSCKTAEYLEGISLLWQHRQTLAAPFKSYCQIIQALNPKELRFYPGSPYLAMSLLRAQDRLVCAELHPREFEHLKQLPTNGMRVVYQQTDGIKALTALLPPLERRGLVFIDPSYELKDEYKSLPKAISTAYKRFATGTYCLWYPIVDKRLHQQLLRGLKAIQCPNTLQIEFYLTAAIKSVNGHAGMNGCGLWIINPPFVLKDDMKIILNVLRTLFNPCISSYLLDMS
jgi:23S rRNA (adenine2030-N6)-methyltransferase